MKYILSEGVDEGIAALSSRLISELGENNNVLWLISGGSNIENTVNVMGMVPKGITSKLTIMPIDERYGKAGHDDSNLQQLLNTGFQKKDSRLISVLEDSLDFEHSAQRYEQLADEEFEKNQIVIAQVGIGADGHVAGILPDSKAAREQDNWVCAYESTPYSRLTLTFPALLKINAAFVFAFGQEKKEALSLLRRRSLPLETQPAQILKQISEVYVYSDQAGDND